MVRGVLFDVFGTLLDVYGVTARAEQMFPGQGARLAALWRDKQIEYSRLRTLSARYVPFSQLTRDALEFVLDTMALRNDPSAVRELMAEYDRLPAFGDALPTLQRLQGAGIPLGVLSNGDPSMLERALTAAGLRPLLQWLLSADQVQAFKTSGKVYELGPRTLDADAGDIAFVSANGWDACAARWFGYQSFWVNRDQRAAERLGVEPSGTGSSLDAAADFFSQTS